MVSDQLPMGWVYWPKENVPFLLISDHGRISQKKLSTERAKAVRRMDRQFFGKYICMAVHDLHTLSQSILLFKQKYVGMTCHIINIQLIIMINWPSNTILSRAALVILKIIVRCDLSSAKLLIRKGASKFPRHYICILIPEMDVVPSPYAHKLLSYLPLCLY